MQTEAIVYFHVIKGSAAKENWREIPTPCMQEAAEGFWNRPVFHIFIHEKYKYQKTLFTRKIKGYVEWEEEPFLLYMTHALENLSQRCHTDRCYYMWEKEIKVFFDWLMLLFPMDVHLPDDFVERLMESHKKYEGLILLDGEEVCGEEFIQTYAGGKNYLGIVTQNEEKYEEVLEDIYEEWGLAAVITKESGAIRGALEGKTLVVDGGFEERKGWRNFPKGCAYLDLTSSKEKQRNLEARRKDITYFSFQKEIGN